MTNPVSMFPALEQKKGPHFNITKIAAAKGRVEVFS